MSEDRKWVVSSACGNGATCVEIGFGPGEVVLRDAKDRGGPVLTFTANEWAAFLVGARAGEFGQQP